jgi:hypothetical protein
VGRLIYGMSVADDPVATPLDRPIGLELLERRSLAAGVELLRYAAAR